MLLQSDPRTNFQRAFTVAEQSFGVPRLLDVNFLVGRYAEQSIYIFLHENYMKYILYKLILLSAKKYHGNILYEYTFSEWNTIL